MQVHLTARLENGDGVPRPCPGGHPPRLPSAGGGVGIADSSAGGGGGSGGEEDTTWLSHDGHLDILIGRTLHHVSPDGGCTIHGELQQLLIAAPPPASSGAYPMAPDARGSGKATTGEGIDASASSFRAARRRRAQQAAMLSTVDLMAAAVVEAGLASASATPADASAAAGPAAKSGAIVRVASASGGATAPALAAPLALLPPPPPRTRSFWWSVCHDRDVARFAIMMFLTGTFLFVELIVGVVAGSVALQADAFHMLSDVLSLAVGFHAVRSSRKTATKHATFGLARFEVVGALVNGVFLMATCLGIFLEVLQRFVSLDSAAEHAVDDPKLVMIVAGGGRGDNPGGALGVLGGGGGGAGPRPRGGGGAGGGPGGAAGARGGSGGGQRRRARPRSARRATHSHSHAHGDGAAVAAVEHGHSHDGGGDHGHSHDGGGDHGHSHDGGAEDHGHSHDGGGDHGHSHDGGAEDHGHSHGDGGGVEHGHSHGHGGGGKGKKGGKKARRPRMNMNVYGVLLHIAGDALGSIAVLVAGAIMQFTTWPRRELADPLASLVIVFIILSSSTSLVRRSGNILLQKVPPHIDMEALRRRVLAVPGVLSVHDFHVWQLDDEKVIGSLHILMDRRAGNYRQVQDEVKGVLHAAGIHASTVQPEYLSVAVQSRLEALERVPAAAGAAAALSPIALPALGCTPLPVPSSSPPPLLAPLSSGGAFDKAVLLAAVDACDDIVCSEGCVKASCCPAPAAPAPAPPASAHATGGAAAAPGTSGTSAGAPAAPPV